VVKRTPEELAELVDKYVGIYVDARSRMNQAKKEYEEAKRWLAHEMRESAKN